MRATAKLKVTSRLPHEPNHSDIVNAAWERISKYLGTETIEDARSKADASIEVIETDTGGITANIYLRIR